MLRYVIQILIYKLLLKIYISLFRNEKELRWAWTAWRDRMSHTKELFRQLVDLQNIAAQNNGNVLTHTIYNLTIFEIIIVKIKTTQKKKKYIS